MSTRAAVTQAVSGQVLANDSARLPAIAAGLPHPRIAPKSLVLVVVAHVVAAMALVQHRTQGEIPVERPILVSMVAPESAPALQRPEIQPPQRIPPAPRLVKNKSDARPPQRPEAAAEPDPHLMSQAPAASPAPLAAPTPPAPETAPLAVPQPEATPAASSEPPPQEPSPMVPSPMAPPRFNADYLDNPAPGYPPLSRRLGEQGRVLLRVHVAAAGTAREVVLQQSSGHPRLDEVAADTVRRWKFVPARQGGQPVDAWVIVPITFNLKG